MVCSGRPAMKNSVTSSSAASTGHAHRTTMACGSNTLGSTDHPCGPASTPSTTRAKSAGLPAKNVASGRTSGIGSMASATHDIPTAPVTVRQAVVRTRDWRKTMRGELSSQTSSRRTCAFQGRRGSSPRRQNQWLGERVGPSATTTRTGPDLLTRAGTARRPSQQSNLPPDACGYRRRHHRMLLIIP